MKVAIVSEFYPRAHDPVLGVWAHRQALAARDAGADVRVLVLHRPVPPRATRLRDFLATISPDEFTRTIDVLENGPNPLTECVYCVFEEEFWHNRYALRDLALLEAGT